MTNPKPEAWLDLEARVKQLMEAYWGVSGHNKPEKLPMYLEAIMEAFTQKHQAQLIAVVEEVIGPDFKDADIKSTSSIIRNRAVANNVRAEQRKRAAAVLQRIKEGKT